QHDQRIAATVAYPAAEENVPTLQLYPDDVLTERRESALDRCSQIGVNLLVSIQSHDPSRVDRRIVERPLKLLALVDELVLEDRRALRTGDMHRVVCRERVDHKDLAGKGPDKIQRAPDMDAFVVGENDDGEIGHLLTPSCAVAAPGPGYPRTPSRARD